MKITDKYISDLFEGSNFGTTINGSVDLQRIELIKSIKNQIDGYWTGHAMYSIMVYGGFIIDGKKGSRKELTALGDLFISEDSAVSTPGDSFMG